jgi:hypothetical protein
MINQQHIAAAPDRYFILVLQVVSQLLLLADPLTVSFPTISLAMVSPVRSLRTE